VRGSVRIFRRDLLRLVRVPAAWIVIIGMAFVPAFYAWFNIAGFWDPYANTSQIRVAVANEDEGATKDSLGTINVGAMLATQLKQNDQLGWHLVSADEALAEALEVGARAYVLKSVHGAEISDVVRAVADGRVLLDERTVTRRRADHDDPTADLTNAERKVLVLIGEGLSNREIGAQLGVAEKTVKNHITSLLAKMGLQRRTQVAAWVASQRASGWRAGSRS